MEHDTEPCGPPDSAEQCDDLYPYMLLQARVEILDGQATAAGMNRLFDGDSVKDTVKK